jgi:hypothetical protein
MLSPAFLFRVIQVIFTVGLIIAVVFLVVTAIRYLIRVTFLGGRASFLDELKFWKKFKKTKK